MNHFRFMQLAPATAFVFPGQGGQHVGMAKELCDQYPAARLALEEADDLLGVSISRLCFAGPEEALTDTVNAQPAILAASIAALRSLESELEGQSDARPDLESPRFVAGHSFGGGQSLQLGMRQSEKLSATIIYYGSVVTDLEVLRASYPAEPVFGVFGEEDQQILPADVLEFEANLNTLNIENEITIYPGVGHAFLTEENYNQPGTAMEAWQQTLAFLNETLK